MDIATTFLLADTWGMHGDGDIGAGWWIVMMVAMVLFWGAIILGIVWLFRGASGGTSDGWHESRRRETPLEVLERRFAEGAISIEEYRQRRELLGNGASGASKTGD